MNPFDLRTRVRPGQCRVQGCRGRATHRSGNGRFCRRCRDRRYKATHPLTYALNKLRNNARRRGIPFDLTLEEFTMFCDLTGYASAAGRFADDLSIDRIDPRRGYSLDNIRAVTVSQNSRLAHVQRNLERLDRVKRAVDRLYREAHDALYRETIGFVA